MILLSDKIAFAEQCVDTSHNWRTCSIHKLPPAIRQIADELYETDSIKVSEAPENIHWDYMFAVDHARQSQYDVLSELAVSGHQFPGRVLCCAGTGEQFHGFKNRDWRACKGNIHMSAVIAPGAHITGGAAGFIAAAVIATLQTVDAFDLGNAETGIKWVNDLLVRGAKVGGVLARLQTQGAVTKSAIVGIGLNVEQSPVVERDPYVPQVAALADFAAEPARCRYPDVFPYLVENLGRNLSGLVDGGFEQLLDTYRQHSLVLNREVTIREDKSGSDPDVIACGVVESIGPELELYIRGHPRPVTKGRLVLD